MENQNILDALINEMLRVTRLTEQLYPLRKDASRERTLPAGTEPYHYFDVMVQNGQKAISDWDTVEMIKVYQLLKKING